ncbi:MAG: hypothetical protein NTX82_04000 [Candidatus Parcubacteria bacterium]|nr:hypothetical protein [Candidatus Parcubacteria bacterium]
MPLKCPQCNQEIPDGNENCPYCGYKPKFAEKQINMTWETSGTNLIKLFFIGAFAITLIAIVNAYFLLSDDKMNVIETDNGFVQVSCVKSADCPLPMDYAARSNCPYQAFCADYHCVVACPMWEDQQNKWEVKCQSDTDCDCSIWDSEGKYDCKCLDGMCVSVVDKIK